MKNSKGITLVALIITIIILLILAVLSIREINGNGIISHSIESSFRTELAQIKEKIRIDNFERALNQSDSMILKQIPISDTENWEQTLKNEIIYWAEDSGQFELTINSANDTYIKENFSKIVGNAGIVQGIYYVESDEVDEKTYIYNETLDLVYKIPATRIGKYKVHRVEELDYQKNGGTRSKDKSYTKISYEVGLTDENYYEPNLNGFGQEVTMLIFYNLAEDGTLIGTYEMPAGEWLERGRPKTFENYTLYDYSDATNKIWANLKVINGGIETNWVWVPRYEYKNETITTDGNTEYKTSINFIEVGEQLSEGYTIAPAFEGNDKKGIWVSKYEPTAVTVETDYYSYYIPDLTGFDLESTYLQIYDKDVKSFKNEEIKASTVVNNLRAFSKKNLWFDYDKQVWANIKVIKNDIETWWVWIPRYAFKNDETSTDIIFVDTANRPIGGEKLPAGYVIAPAFEGNDKKGIWVSKYEPSGTLENN